MYVLTQLALRQGRIENIDFIPFDFCFFLFLLSFYFFIILKLETKYLYGYTSYFFFKSRK